MWSQRPPGRTGEGGDGGGLYGGRVVRGETPDIWEEEAVRLGDVESGRGVGPG